MSLTTTQSIALNGESTVDGKQVATFSTVVSTGLSYTTVSMQITDKDLYESNKTDVRKDRNDFQDITDNLTDNLESGSAKGTE
ncbi:hypothetical protein EFL77_05395 [Pediococcus pentosaceus]|uniref:hypothetical protein n=1 Tax=Pediococcus pentosaceus TaxID=1255 RepID=UPI00223AAC10|nr:hypothetical protein [Pediococcus pentosaceus]MCT1177938.1 hypothetical protein [Pediococcus pentosaceus]